MKKQLTMLLMAATLLLLPSCYATRTNVGGYREDKKEAHARSYTYAKGKQVYLLWGLIPLGRTSVATPADGVCQIKTRQGVGDAIVSLLTGGILSMQTIKVIATREVPKRAQPSQESAQSQETAPSEQAQQ